MTEIQAPSPQYQRHQPMHEQDCPDLPSDLFAQWFAVASEQMGRSAEQMILGTVGEGGQSHQRVVLLKEFTQSAYIFYTNYQSLKCQDIERIPRVSLLFWWPVLERQIRIEGSAFKVDRVKSEAYFATRIDPSKIAAWASPQSEVITAEALDAAYLAQEDRFKDKASIPCPEFWGGIRVQADYYEFWQGADARLHDRMVYRWTDDAWQRFRLAP